jgi:sugar lactone lactonase YvrE
MQRLFSFVVPALLGAAVVEAVPTLPILRTALPAANGIVAAHDGTLYFADSFHNTVWRVSPGAGIAAFVTGVGGGSLHVDGEGNLYGTRAVGRHQTVLWRADPNGVVTDLSSSADAGDFALDQVTTRTTGGRLLVTADRSVKRVGLDGRVTVIAADVPFLQPRSGKLRRFFRGASPHLTGIAEAADGRIYIANATRGAIVGFLPGGGAEEVIRTEQGWTPAGVVAAHGVIYVLEHGAGVRVRRIENSGDSSIIASVPARGDRRVAVHGVAPLPDRLH